MGMAIWRFVEVQLDEWIHAFLSRWAGSFYRKSVCKVQMIRREHPHRLTIVPLIDYEMQKDIRGIDLYPSLM